jgi:hypothetical protein
MYRRLPSPRPILRLRRVPLLLPRRRPRNHRRKALRRLLRLPHLKGTIRQGYGIDREGEEGGEA